MGYRLGYSGPEVDALLQKAYNYSVINNGWTKLDSSDSNPVDLDYLVTQGNYSLSFWSNGPTQLNTSGPINICITKDSSNGKTYQTIYDAGKVYLRDTTTTSFSNTWIENQNITDLDINASIPQNPQDNYIWIDTSGEEPIIKVYKESTQSWVPVSAADLAKASVYDVNGIKQPIDTYLDQKIADANLSKAEEDYNAHLVEGESSGNPIHVTTEEKAKWNAGISKTDASTIVDALKTEMTSYANQQINASTQEISDISDEINTIASNIDAHIADNTIHITAKDITNFDNKAAGDHKHLNDGHVTVSAANITGMIAVERLDPSVLERNYTVSSYEEMMTLTKNEIQNGDSVFINGTKQSAWFVVDDNKLGEESTSTSEIIVSDSSRGWYSICYGNDKFVAVGYDSNYFAYSTDGITWTESTISSTSRYWWSVCYGNDKYVAVAWGSKFAYSTDGIHWTESTISSTDRKWESVCYGNDKYVAVAYNSNYFAYSTDGITWTESTISSTNRNWNSVCYGNGKFVAVAISSTYFAYSTDGITWTESTISSTSRYWRSVCYGNGKFVAISGGTSYTSNIFAYSSDGITWTESTISSTSRKWESVCYGNGKFVAVADSTKFAYSTNGINWTESTISTTSREWRSVCYGNGKFVVVAWNSNYSVTIMFSPAGLVQYAAPAKDLAWENITNKPSTLAEFNITTSYTKDEINTLYNNILASINEVKNKADEYNAAIPTEIPSDLDETITTNTTSVNNLNSKVDILIKNTSFDETFKNHLLSLVQNKVVGNVDIYMNKTVTISYNWTVTGGPGLSTGINLPTATVYDLDLEVSNNYLYTVDETYTSESRDEHGDKGYYSFSGWSY